MQKLLINSVSVLVLSAAAAAAENTNAQFGSALSVSGAANAQVIKAAYDAPESMSLTFIFHIDDGMAEQDVFYEKISGSGEVFRPTAATRDMDAPLYAPGVEVKHNFLDTTDTGPYPIGRPLGLTLGEWFAAKGSGTYICENGVGTVDLSFENLVPDGVYTIWHDFMVWPPTEPFIGTYDLPFGARDGSENTFIAKADGSADFGHTISPCLQLSGEHLAADLALAWHSDGNTYGPLPGEFSTVTHVQMYVALPSRTGL
ncbi:hypothetical protein [Sedimentitalea todarodis]|uniref:DUF4198 domain-containing protein n=1 Tax=Sedimentitalea todarodis TaxID=1631240 RepID=A0ABU3VLX7_9RHOB|nr:hypothetical protein [Sedimentitalea todarodis]MDU9007108.1 hypothetical protein [Sedimentitalea todarodis]